MTEFLLDTAPLAGVLYGKPAAIERFQPAIERGLVSTTLISYGEAFEGVFSLPNREAHLAAIADFLEEIHPLGLSRVIVERYAMLRRSLRHPYGAGLIGDIDTLIAATAIEHHLILVTTDSDFLRVPGLNLLLLQPKTFEVRSAHRN